MEAADLLERMVEAAHFSGEPGLAFLEAINRANPTPELGPSGSHQPPAASSPCCPTSPATWAPWCCPALCAGGAVDFAALEEAAALGVRFLDDVIQVTRHPLPARGPGHRPHPQDRPGGSWAWPTSWPPWAWPTPRPRRWPWAGRSWPRIQAAAPPGQRRAGPSAGQLPRF